MLICIYDKYITMMNKSLSITGTIHFILYPVTILYPIQCNIYYSCSHISFLFLYQLTLLFLSLEAEDRLHLMYNIEQWAFCHIVPPYLTFLSVARSVHIHRVVCLFVISKVCDAPSICLPSKTEWLIYSFLFWLYIHVTLRFCVPYYKTDLVNYMSYPTISWTEVKWFFL